MKDGLDTVVWIDVLCVDHTQSPNALHDAEGLRSAIARMDHVLMVSIIFFVLAYFLLRMLGSGVSTVAQPACSDWDAVHMDDVLRAHRPFEQALHRSH